MRARSRETCGDSVGHAGRESETDSSSDEGSGILSEQLDACNHSGGEDDRSRIEDQSELQVRSGDRFEESHGTIPVPISHRHPARFDDFPERGAQTI